jgi:F-type H+-transporting ATPase subunit b
MKFNIWTLLFQIINFVVLLVILKRILYKPVREVMEKRRGMIEQKVREAEHTRNEAQALRDKYQAEMNGLKELKSRMLEDLQGEVNDERKRLIGKAREDADRIAAREKVLLNAEKQTIEAEIKEKILDSVSVFSSNLLRDITDETLHKAAFRKFIGELGSFAPKLRKMKEETAPLAIELAAAYPLNAGDIEKVRETVQSHTARTVVVTAVVDHSLIGGVRMKAEDQLFDASLAGQILALKEKLKGTA